MRKGDAKRQQLLGEAEKLFCQRGYDKTSVQDILAAAGISKGGFYHHFDSKDEVLTALCQRRAERAAAFTADALDATHTPMERINAVLRGFIPMRLEETAFLNMLLPVIARAEGRAIAMTYQDALESHFLPLLRAEIAAAMGTVFDKLYDDLRCFLRVDFRRACVDLRYDFYAEHRLKDFSHHVQAVLGRFGNQLGDFHSLFQTDRRLFRLVDCHGVFAGLAEYWQYLGRYPAFKAFRRRELAGEDQAV